ncbi:MAG TPA: IclR family transcriptional regulator [Victivallales bacterium]|nr:IclR family transcriptional regulator [Victivallales bacterium]HPO91442.1 IclR family transcriptional regulator [Victivallales bacterium]HRR05754.1 IclR family transcriptional regulator [Victivallales bacterium]HRR28507.1 IclR family transcriptional regulator [Victivallales bacterium]HRU00284.1 IclR family transcriptional regulator [Victivallales bacterium]
MNLSKKTKNSGVQSVERALQILKTIASHDTPVGVRELANWLNLKPPTVHNILKTLAKMRFIEQNEKNRKYELGISSLILGLSSEKIMEKQISYASHQIIEELSLKIDETVALYGIINGFVFSLDVVNRIKELSVQLRPNTYISIPHLTAAGRVLLAFSSADLQEKYAKNMLEEKKLFPYKTINNMFQDFASIRRKKYAELENINSSGLYAISVPINGIFNKHNLAISVCLPIFRKTREKREIILDELYKTASEIDEKIIKSTKGNKEV